MDPSGRQRRTQTPENWGVACGVWWCPVVPQVAFSHDSGCGLVLVLEQAVYRGVQAKVDPSGRQRRMRAPEPLGVACGGYRHPVVFLPAGSPVGSHGRLGSAWCVRGCLPRLERGLEENPWLPDHCRGQVFSTCRVRGCLLQLGRGPLKNPRVPVRCHVWVC